MEKINKILISILLLISLYFPTSLNGEISNNLEVILTALISIVFLLLFFLNAKKINVKSLLSVFIINFSILFFTLISPFKEYTFGSYLSYFLISLMLVLQLYNLRLSKNEILFFQSLNVTILLIALFMILKNSLVGEILVNYFSAGYDTLVYRMVIRGKPVTTFGTHSIAAMFYYLFFFMNLKEYEVTKSKKSLLLIVLDILAMFFLNSVSSTLLVIVSIIQFYLFIVSKKKFIALFFMTFFIAIVVIGNFQAISMEIVDVLQRDAHGFTGRYSSQGVLANNIEYLMENPFRGIGISYNKNLYYTDSGILINLLRGSLFLMFSIYYGLYKMISINLKNKNLGLYFFILVIAFEFGYSLLTYKRFIALIPYLVVFFNSLNNYEHNNEENGVEI